MDDIFYFTRDIVDFDAIRELSQKVGYASDRIVHEKFKYLNIYHEDRFWQWSHWYDLDSLDPDERDKLVTYEPRSSYLISYDVESLSELARLLRVVLETYGGWVACDDNWLTTYDERNIEGIACQ